MDIKKLAKRVLAGVVLVGALVVGTNMYHHGDPPGVPGGAPLAAVAVQV